MERRLFLRFACWATALVLLSSTRPVFAGNSHHTCIKQGARIIEVAEKYLWITEATGKNDGHFIEALQRSTNSPRYSAYCASFVDSVLREAGVLVTARSAWSPSWFPVARRVVWQNQRVKQERYYKLPGKEHEGRVLGMRFPKLGRIGHVEFIKDQIGDYYRGRGANTSNGNSRGERARNGGGIFPTTRHKTQVNAIADWHNCI